jgi:tRNA modification GTPase
MTMRLLDSVRDPVACRVTLLTAPSRGAVATISVEGRDAASLVASHFQLRTGRMARPLPIGRILFGRWRNLTGSEEEVVVCRRSECSFEVSCHGGHAASNAVIGSLLAEGAARLGADEWLAARISDPIRRAAWLAVSESQTARTAGILLDQFRGALTNRIGAIVSELEEAQRAARRAPDNARQRLERLLDLAGVGMHLTTPWQVVVAGPPNAGKSSLVNAILGYQRAIVLDQPGTTRDVLTAAATFDGWPLQLSDTAGLRASDNETEIEGIARARRQIAGADLVVFVEDLTCPQLDVEDPMMLAERSLRVLNKCDLRSARRTEEPDRLRTSAVTGEGVEQLMRAIVQRLVPKPPLPGEAVPFTRQQLEWIRAIHDALHNGQLAAAIALGKDLAKREG